MAEGDREHRLRRQLYLVVADEDPVGLLLEGLQGVGGLCELVERLDEGRDELVELIVQPMGGADLGEVVEALDRLAKHLVVLGGLENNGEGGDDAVPGDEEHVSSMDRSHRRSSDERVAIFLPHSGEQVVPSRLSVRVSIHIREVLRHLDLAGGNAVVDVREESEREVLVVVDSPVHLHEVFFRHLLLHLVVVQVRVEHDDGVGEDVGCVSVGKGPRRLTEVMACKPLHDTSDLL
mmetsp:Transcript_24702/g.81008  ORF Transcript_24702/g.81008 Transcript_24702/m.81008 type:complete len:235 (+) Transcript_24702:1819-2523(+)